MVDPPYCRCSAVKLSMSSPFFFFNVATNIEISVGVTGWIATEQFSQILIISSASMHQLSIAYFTPSMYQTQ
jgi:Kef-type K+ transport system membrane component KefB